MMISLLLTGFLTFVSLNCENLFDCRHDSLKDDTQWLPDGENHWTTTRYWRKVNNIGQEILACGDPTPGPSPAGRGALNREDAGQIPDLVALCEVENDSVLVDITRRSLLRNARYQYVATDSPDPRGIDVALLYSPFTFQLLHHHALRVEPLPDMHPTRDILYVCGRLITGDTLHVYVVHAPSRSGGEHLTRDHRLQVARRLTQSIDSIHTFSPQALIVVAGDFNDFGRARSLRAIEEAGMTDVSRDARGENGAEGTYRHQGEWNMLDHVFASPRMAARVSDCHIFDAPFLLEPDETYGGVKPRRYYMGPRYLAGFSDHLPLVVRFRLQY